MDQDDTFFIAVWILIILACGHGIRVIANGC